MRSVGAGVKESQAAVGLTLDSSLEISFITTFTQCYFER